MTSARCTVAALPFPEHKECAVRLVDEDRRALGLASPNAKAAAPIPVDPCDVRRRDLLGGLPHEYDGLAA